jgi:hypothetical protein
MFCMLSMLSLLPRTSSYGVLGGTYVSRCSGDDQCNRVSAFCILQLKVINHSPSLVGPISAVSCCGGCYYNLLALTAMWCSFWRRVFSRG